MAQCLRLICFLTIVVLVFVDIYCTFRYVSVNVGSQYIMIHHFYAILMPQNFDLLPNTVQVHHEQFSFWVWCSRFEGLIISEFHLNQIPDPSLPWETNLMNIHRLFHPFLIEIFWPTKVILYFTARYGHASCQWIRKVWSRIYNEYQGHRESLFRTTQCPR